MSLKRTLKAAPVIGPLISKMCGPAFVASSADYWEDRYRAGGHSGAGSYNRLAEFKAKFLNEFVAKHGIETVIEFGSGDGAQLALAQYPRYIGIDVAPTAVDACRMRFADQPNYTFLHSRDASDDLRADLSLSLDVIYHLVENPVFEGYMSRLFDAAQKAVIIYSSNVDRAEASHVRHRKFTRWVEKNRPDFRLFQVMRNRYQFDPKDNVNTSFADFYVYLR